MSKRKWEVDLKTEDNKLAFIQFFGKTEEKVKQNLVALDVSDKVFYRKCLLIVNENELLDYENCPDANGGVKPVAEPKPIIKEEKDPDEEELLKAKAEAAQKVRPKPKSSIISPSKLTDHPQIIPLKPLYED